MPRLPQIRVLAQEMDGAMAAQVVADVEIVQPNCWNVPEADFKASLQGAAITGVTAQGNWLKVATAQGWL